MLPKENRLKDGKEFQYTYLKGKFFSFGPVTVRITRNELLVSRFGFVVGKSFAKKAVDRNRAKRILRSATAPYVAKLLPGYDLVIGLRKPLPGQKMSVLALSEALGTIFKRNNLLK